MAYEVRGNLDGYKITTFQTAREALDCAEEISNQGGTVTWIKKDGKPIEGPRLRELAANEKEGEPGEDGF